MKKRIFDIIFSLSAILILAVPLFVISLIVKVSSSGPIIYWSKRVCRGGVDCFFMPKFRTMLDGAPELSTEDFVNAKDFITFVGKFLRKTSLDELPQFFSVLAGHMSIVGPRPALWNEKKLIKERSIHKVDLVKPGITGLAQICGRDDLSIIKKVELDKKYMETANLRLDIFIILKTISVVFSGRGLRF
jgi:O-antigen biosynthesis protein WbqP